MAYIFGLFDREQLKQIVAEGYLVVEIKSDADLVAEMGDAKGLPFSELQNSGKDEWLTFASVWVDAGPEEFLLPFGTIVKGKKESATKEQIEQARERYARPSDDDIEVDEDAQASHADTGVWVSGWLWLPYKNDEDEAAE